MKKLALCVGINQYGGNNSLSGCVNDSNDWKAALEARGFTVATLLDKQATGKAIRERVVDTTQQAERGDSILVQFSGHGSFIPDKDGDETDGVDEIICPVDIYNDQITDDELFQMGSEARARGIKMVFISDSCHSGSVMRFAPITTPPTIKSGNAPQRKVRFLPPQNFLTPKEVDKAEKALRFGVKRPPWKYAGLLMSGCADTEYSFDAWFEGRPNGAFTFVALKALGKVKSGSYSKWYSAIRKALPSQQYAQTPQLFGASEMKRWKILG